MQDKQVVATHHRHFHNDEVMAIALLELYYFEGKSYELVRTRDEKILKPLKNDPNSFVIDVGFDYNPDKKNFDHHQAGMNDGWEDGIPYSSCGLIWKWLREQKKLHQHMNEDTMNLLEERLIKKIDAQDNGIEKWVEGTFISMYNRKHDDEKVVDRQFKRALSAAKDFFINFFYQLRQEMKSTKEIEKSIRKSEEIPDVVVMDSNVKVAPVEIAKRTSKKMMVIPRTNNSWKIQTVPISPQQPYSKLCPMPKEWRGLKDKELIKASGIEGLIFCHKDGFMCMFEGPKEEAVKLARFIVLRHEGLV